MGMNDPNLLLGKLVETLQSNSDLVTALGGQTGSILAYTWESAEGMNLDIAIQQQPVPSIMVCWLGTRTGNYQNHEAIKHDFEIYLKPDETITIGALFKIIREGVCTVPEELKFKLLQIDESVHPPADMSCKPATRLIAANYAVFDYPVIALTLVERGIDN